MNTIADRFWSKVDRRHNTECWLWTAHRNNDGYGNFRFKGKIEKAHRVAWFLRFGVMPPLHALHYCDNRACVNPAHLFTGTHQDNMTDRMAKGRQAKGKKNGLSKLTDDVVREIRNSKESQRKLAARFGVSSTTIRLARNRKTWTHVS